MIYWRRSDLAQILWWKVQIFANMPPARVSGPRVLSITTITTVPANNSNEEHDPQEIKSALSKLKARRNQIQYRSAQAKHRASGFVKSPVAADCGAAAPSP